MSLDINVFIEKSRMISPSDWQSHLDQEGFPLQLYPDFDPFKFSGMLPCEFDGEEAGFEYYFDVLEDTMFNPDSDPELAERLGARDICVGFSVSAGLPERSAQAAMIAAATLASAAGGLLWIDPEFVETEDPIAMVKDGLG
jgi:hypothetical protein